MCRSACAVKSEGGVECQKVQQELTAGSYDEYGQPIGLQAGSDGMQLTKPDPDMWPGVGGMMM